MVTSLFPLIPSTMNPKLRRSIFLSLVIWSALACQTNAQPDTTTNRYATAEDAAYWHNVNEGDFLLFKGNTDKGGKIYSAPNNTPINLPLGGRILLYSNSYERIYIDGSGCQNTREQPTVITNFGGQVKWGNSEDANQYRGMELVNFKHVHLTGKYDPDKQTGDPDFRGHDGGKALGSGDYYEKYGMWGDMRWSGPRFYGGYGNIVRAYRYDSIKIDYVAAWGGGFASFNLKEDGPADPGVVDVDIQDTFTGIGEGEGFYISYSTEAVGQDATRLTLRNNIVVFSGAEGLQTDNLAPGSVIENNVIICTGQFYRMPFQAIYQDNGHQLSYVAGGVTVRNNLMYGVVGYLIGPRYRAAEQGRFTPAASDPVVIENNYFGYGEGNIGYVPEGDAVTPLKFINNTFGPISVPSSDDSYSTPQVPPYFLNLSISNCPITLKDNLYPAGAPFYAFTRGNGANLVVNEGNQQAEAQPILFVDLGFGDSFDPRYTGFYAAVWSNTPDGVKNGQPVAYKAGDIVHLYDDNGDTFFFKCLENHTADANNHPLVNAGGEWEHLTWNGRNLPPFDVRLKGDTYYNYRGIGLTYNEANQYPADFEAPVMSIDDPVVQFTRGSEYFEFGVHATDNIDGDISGKVLGAWVGEPFNSDAPGTYRIRYSVTDRAGNVAPTVDREVRVSDPTVARLREYRVNFHRYGAANLAGWTDLGNDAEGLRISGNPTSTNLFDTAGSDTGVELLIENINGGYSEHYKNHVNTAGVDIGNFPAAITAQGLRIRDPYENPCVLVFTGLNTSASYNVRFTGYVDSGSAVLESTLTHAPSGQAATINVRHNSSDTGTLINIQPDQNGRMDLSFSTPTSFGQPNISGVILEENSGLGLAGGHPVMTGVADQTVEPDTQSLLFDLTVSDSDTDAKDLQVSWSSSNTARIPQEAISISGSGAVRSMSIDTTGLPAATTPVTFMVTDGGYFFASTALITVAETYQDWARIHFQDQMDSPELEAAIWGPNANPDRDALANALERLFNRDPNQPSETGIPFSLTNSANGTQFVFSVSASVPAVEWRLEESGDMLTWTDVSAQLDGPWADESMDLYALSVDLNQVPPVFFRILTSN